MSFYGVGRELDMLQDAMEASGMAWWMMEYPSGTVFYAPNKLKMLGYEPSDADKFIHFSHFTDLIHPDDFDGAMASMRALMTGASEYYETRYRIRTKSGGYVVFYDKGRIVGRNNKGEIAIAGTVMNITANPVDSTGLPITPVTTPSE